MRVPDEAATIWRQLDLLTAEHRLPDRVTDLLYEAVLGYRLRRGGYVKLAGIEQRTASRDLAQLVELGLLKAVGERRARHYLAGPVLRGLRDRCREQRRPIRDPYPWLPAVRGGGDLTGQRAISVLRDSRMTVTRT